ncbi:MAG TPA: 50S ribosomal protein L5 [Anaerohalosphaeraceae bacterium]|jgi:large subunit ribosomal protein L5|nr:50S ribosomal protein L5 [Phycisphaerae bacterium]HOM61052.1 50S ribosomal protein L5 [Anaerohalosphaeraceae bacterium]HOT71908.1 50S ribosomal protein L5 [Anaerohalosphaeraceae bacterium]HPB91997.1 50S ribosomal protein L5 [Anaerohalosphaeraceae bacterium]HQG05290.1 50S ribosomal protein L5 [Anaerohalosphaeraceae bacterium]
MARLKVLYKSKVVPALKEKFGYTTPMAVPRLEKIVVSMGVGKATQDKKFLDLAIRDLTVVTGQKPLICTAKKSVSNFKVRQGDKTGLKVTLRRERMYEFLDRLVNLAIPRVKDFRGLNPNGFDGHGNYSMGLEEQSVFPEIDPARIEVNQGMNITFVTSAKTDEEGREMLRLFGMPFRS